MSKIVNNGASTFCCNWCYKVVVMLDPAFKSDDVPTGWEKHLVEMTIELDYTDTIDRHSCETCSNIKDILE